MTPAPVKAAATVCVVRDGPSGFEVLLVRRSPSAPFVPGASVFPGGKVDAVDARADDAFKAAVIRETFEEVGFLLADRTGSPFDSSKPLQMQRSPDDFLYDELVYLSTWVTPEWMGLRFDTRFYLAAAPDRVELVIDRTELDAADWVRPAEALQRWAAGDITLIMPTVAHLRYLDHYKTVNAAFQGAIGGRHAAEIDQEIQEGRRPAGLT